MLVRRPAFLFANAQVSMRGCQEGRGGSGWAVEGEHAATDSEEGRGSSDSSDYTITHAPRGTGWARRGRGWQERSGWQRGRIAMSMPLPLTRHGCVRRRPDLRFPGDDDSTLSSDARPRWRLPHRSFTPSIADDVSG